MPLNYQRLKERISSAQTIRRMGRVCQVVGLIVESEGPSVSVGDICAIENQSGGVVEAEVVGFRDQRLLLMPLGDLRGVNPGAIVVSRGEQLKIGVGKELIGRTVDGLGRPIDNKGNLHATTYRSINASPPPALSRPCIKEPLRTGVRAIDMTCACGQGQRIGIFAGSGVGKSTLLGMMARGSNADVNVIALIGERGREVREFIENDLGEVGLKRSVIVAVTSDQPALLRVKGAMVATTIAEHFRDQGMKVALMMDSVTRVAMAQREIGLAVGEPPTTKGYTPSVYALLPKLLERAGASEKGSITGFYTVLVEGDDLNEPVSDLSRSILDGHISLSRKLAARNQYPAVDVLNSISRLMRSVSTEEEVAMAGEVREIYATYADAEDLISIGAYSKGASPTIDRAIAKTPLLNKYFRQRIDDQCDFTVAKADLSAILRDVPVATAVMSASGGAPSQGAGDQTIENQYLGNRRSGGTLPSKQAPPTSVTSPTSASKSTAIKRNEAVFIPA